MVFTLLADLVLILHFLFILFVIFGGLLLLLSKYSIFLHFPALIWGMSIEFFGWICPLTPLENRLREAGNRSGYEGGFIEHYLAPIIYPAGLTRDIQLFLGVSVLVVNLVVYTAIIVRDQKKRTG